MIRDAYGGTAWFPFSGDSVTFHGLPYCLAAVAAAVQSQCRAVAYTYSEPVTFIEYMSAIGGKARFAGLKNLLIQNQNASPQRHKAHRDILNTVCIYATLSLELTKKNIQ